MKLLEYFFLKLSLLSRYLQTAVITESINLPTDLTAEYSTEDTTFHWLNLIHISDRNFSISRSNFKLIAKHLS